MPRNTGGQYSEPNGSFTTGTVIRSDVMNAKFADLATEMSDSLSRSGNGDMLAPLRLDDGSAAVPSLSFSVDPEIGLYLAAENDLRMVSHAANLQKWATTGVTIYPATTIDDALTVTGNLTLSGSVLTGLTVTQSTANGAGVTATGNGTGSGVVGTGGAPSAATGGAGGTFTGGTPSSGNNNGGAGVVATGGVASGTGTGGNGVSGTGGSSGGHGVVGVGGTGGRGGMFTGSAGNEGARVTAGTTATASQRYNALGIIGGDVGFATENPNSNVAFSNTLTPALITKAYAKVTTSGTGAVTVNGGVNITAAMSGTSVRFTFPTNGAMANANYTVTVTNQGSQGVEYYVGAQTTTYFDVAAYTYTLNGTGTAVVSSGISLATTAQIFHVHVDGLQ